MTTRREPTPTPGKRTVVLLASYTPSLVNFRGALIRRLVAHGHRVLAVGPPDDLWRSRVEATGAEFHPIAFDRTGTNVIGDLRYARAVRQLIQREHGEVVLAYTAKPIIWGIPAARKGGATVRVSLVTGLGHLFRSDARWDAYAAVGRRLYRRALSASTAVRFQNPDDQADFTRQGLVSSSKSSIVAGSGVDLDHYRPVDPPGEPPIRFLLIARLLASKGIRDFVEAARIVRMRRDDCQFDLVGPFDPNPAGLRREEVDEWVAEGVVNYCGPIEDVRPALANCHVYVLPSYREGTPRSVLEAMAMRRPIITTDVPGCRATTAQGVNGLLVPPRAPEALAAAMIRLADDPALRERMGAASLALARQTYDVELVNDEMMDALGLSQGRANGPCDAEETV